MDETVDSAIMDKLTKVCTCKGITRATIKKAIAGGNVTVAAVNKATGAGSGACKGKNCGPKIERFIEENT